MPKKSQPQISVVIPVYNAPEDLKRCVESLERTARGLYELILVDNASGLPTRRYIAGLRGAVKLRNTKNLGFAKAVNQGLKAASGRYLAVVNSDVAFYEGGLAGLADCLDRDPAAGACGPVTNRTVGVQRVVLAPKVEKDPRALGVFAQAMGLRFGRDAYEVHRLVGFCFMVRREAFESVGLLDERFGTGCFEDFDYSLRLRQAGWKLKVAKGVFVWHRHHASFDGHEHFHSWAVKNRGVFVDKWCRKALEFLDELDPYLETPAAALKRRS